MRNGLCLQNILVLRSLQTVCLGQSGLGTEAGRLSAQVWGRMLRNLAACRILDSPWSQQHWSGWGKHHAPDEHEIRSFPPCVSRPSPTKALLAQPWALCLPTGSCCPRSSLTSLQHSPLWKGLSFLALTPSQVLQLPLPMPVSFIKCFQHCYNVGERGWKGIKDLHYTKNCDFSRNGSRTEFFFPRFLLLAFFAYRSEGQGKWVCGTTEDAAEILLLALELPGPAAGQAPSRVPGGREGAPREGGRSWRCSHCSPRWWTCPGRFTSLRLSSRLEMLQLPIPPIERSSFLGKLSPAAKGL